MSEWIKCSDQSPEIDKRLIFLNGKGEVTVGRCFGNEDTDTVWIEDYIRETNEVATYWMPFPTNPEKKEKFHQCEASGYGCKGISGDLMLYTIDKIEFKNVGSYHIMERPIGKCYYCPVCGVASNGMD